MTDLRRDFEQVAEDVKRLGTRPDDDTSLRLYALYKQGSLGDIQAQRRFFYFVGTAKYDACRPAPRPSPSGTRGRPRLAFITLNRHIHTIV